MRKYLTIGEAAKRLGLEVDTVRKLERAGKIKAARTTGGHRRFAQEEIDRYRRNGRKARASKAGAHSCPPQPAPAPGPPAGNGRVRRWLADLDDAGQHRGRLPWDEFDEGDEDLTPPPPVRAEPTDSRCPPKPMPYVLEPARRPTRERARLQTIKDQGRAAVPWGVPDGVGGEGDRRAGAVRDADPVPGLPLARPRPADIVTRTSGGGAPALP